MIDTPFHDARDNLGHLIVQAEEGEAFTITRGGESVAVLIGIEEYRRLTGETTDE